CLDADRGGGQYHVGRERDQFPCVFLTTGKVARPPTQLVGDVAALDPAKFPHPSLEDSRIGARLALGKLREHANPPDPLLLLRPCRLRPRRSRAAEEGDELTSLHECAHSISSSARKRNASGIVSPIAL